MTPRARRWAPQKAVHKAAGWTGQGAEKMVACSKGTRAAHLAGLRAGKMADYLAGKTLDNLNVKNTSWRASVMRY